MIVEIWRTIGSLTYCDFVGFHRGWVNTLTEDRHRLITSRGVSLNHLLQRRRILYPAVTAQTLKSGPAETVIKEFVAENLGASAGPPRIIDGRCPWLEIEATEGRGNDWFGQAAYVNLHDTIKDIALASNIGFTIVRPEPKVFWFQIVNSLERTHLFREDLNTLLTFDLTEEAANVTAAVALGAEIGSTRPTVQVVDAAASISPWNLSESAVDVNLDTYNELLSAAQTEIARGKATQDLTLKINPRTPAIYGVNYNLGDILNVDIRGRSIQQRLSAVDIQVSAGREEIGHTFEAYPG